MSAPTVDALQAAELTERALAYYLQPEAQAWAEDAVRFLKAGQLGPGTEALNAALTHTEGGNRVAYKQLLEARRRLGGLPAA